MIRNCTRYIGTFLTLVVFGLVHVSPAMASSMPHPSGHSDHGAVSCQVACQATPQNQEDELGIEAKEKDDKKDPVPIAGEIELIDSGVGLLRENQIWKQSSWVPPDLLLQSGAYSTSL